MWNAFPVTSILCTLMMSDAVPATSILCIQNPKDANCSSGFQVFFNMVNALFANIVWDILNAIIDMPILTMLPVNYTSSPQRFEILPETSLRSTPPTFQATSIFMCTEQEKCLHKWLMLASSENMLKQGWKDKVTYGLKAKSQKVNSFQRSFTQQPLPRMSYTVMTALLYCAISLNLTLCLVTWTLNKMCLHYPAFVSSPTLIRLWWIALTTLQQ